MAFLFPSLRSAVASSSNSSAASSSSSCRALLRPTFLVPPVVASSGTTATYGQSRGIKFAPKRTKHGMNAMKGRVPIHIGGSTKGTTLAYGGEYGIRATNGVRIKAKQLEAAYEALRRKMKPFKGVEIIMRVFPDRPVTAKGAQARMGKGKGAFDFWACHVPMNHALFELRGGNLRPEIAKEALRVASAKLPTGTQFMTAATLPRVGNFTVHPASPSPSTVEFTVEDLRPLSPEELAAEEAAAALEAELPDDSTEPLAASLGPKRFTRPTRVSEKIASLPAGVKLGIASGQKVMTAV